MNLTGFKSKMSAGLYSLWGAYEKIFPCFSSFLIRKKDYEVAQSCLTLCNPTGSSLPGSCVHGIFQARVLEWGAIAFSTSLCEQAYSDWSLRDE